MEKKETDMKATLITKKHLESYFQFPIHIAASLLSISLQDLRNLCKVYNIKKWPYKFKLQNGDNELYHNFKITKPIKMKQKKEKIEQSCDQRESKEIGETLEIQVENSSLFLKPVVLDEEDISNYLKNKLF
jgi:hypothetical protein